MPTALNIKKTDPNIPSWWLFKELRQQGLEHIAAFSGKLWTDHNLHDPGITILEVLCYAISDLGYRTNLDIEELLALTNGETENNFFTPEQILTCNPFTILDYRKMLVDIPGVRNAWILPANEQEVPLYIDCKEETLQYSSVGNENKSIGALILNGLYKVYLDIDPVFGAAELACEETSSSRDQVLQMVKKRLHQHRNLCEDFLEIIVLQDEQIGVCTDLELEPNANPDLVLEAVYQAIEDTLSPRLHFYSLQEMLDRGKTIIDIFEGRPYTPAYGDRNEKYSHGFIDSAELEAAQLPDRLLASDFYQAIMDVEGVRAIKSLLLNNYKDGIPRTAGEEWALALSKNHRPVFAPTLSTFNFSKGVIRMAANRQRAINRFTKRLQDFRKNKFEASALDLEIPYGNVRQDIAHYPSIQHEFPITYGVGKGHLSDSVPEQRKVKALQLKAYLTFYDQLLAGYLAQLGNIRHLFSWDAANPQSGQTYFQQALSNIPLSNKIFLSSSQASSFTEGNEGEPLAKPPFTFSHPTERDMAIIQLVNLFSSHSSNEEDGIVEVIEQESGFRFVVIGQDGQIILESSRNYDLQEEARRASESLFFQGTLIESYQHNNWPELAEYSFTLVFQVVDYTAYLRSITESKEVYYYRKDQFLNHLLARFGEQFTEYVLLMYALNQGAPDPRDIIQDKSRFLANYPSISRNRGRGFDYIRRDHIWNSKENLSGFEGRVAGLMGLDQWERRFLNNFEVVLREQSYLVRVLDHNETILFETTSAYTHEEVDQAIEDFRTCLEDSSKYKVFHCPTQHVFGFQIAGEDGKVFANYLPTFGTAFLRDEILTCTQNYFSQKAAFLRKKGDDNRLEYDLFIGQRLRIVAEKEGYYFLLLADTDVAAEVYLKSSQAYTTPEEACFAWLAFVQRTQVIDNYVATEGNYDGGAYSFAIFKDDTQTEELAQHPKGYRSKAVRTKKKNAIAKFVSTKQLEYEICRNPNLYSWYAEYDSKCLLLSSNQDFKFKSEEQAEAAWNRFLSYARQADNYILEEAADIFSFSILKEDIVLAISAEFDTAEDRNQALERTQVLLQSQELDLDQINFKVQQHPGQFYFVILGEDGHPALISLNTFDSEEEAHCAYYHFVEKAADPSCYRETVQEGTCLFGFTVEGEAGALAYHPQYYLKDEKHIVQEALITHIQKNRLPFDITALAGSFHFELDWENCEGRCETLFVENGEHASEKQAEASAVAFLSVYTSDTLLNWEVLQEQDGFSFAITNQQGMVLVKHPQWYEQEEQALAARADAEHFMNYYKKLREIPEGQEAPNPQTIFNNIIKKEPKWNVCGHPCDEEQNDEVCLLSGFRLCKTDAPIAYHPTIFDDRSTQHKVLGYLFLKAQCDQIYYTNLCLYGGKITSQQGKQFHYEVWENQLPTLLWRSSTTYSSVAAAEEAFHAHWLQIIEWARKQEHYQLPDEDDPYLSLLDKEGQQIAFFPDLIETEEAAYEKIEFLCKLAKRFPIYSTPEGYRFRVQNEDCTATLWESTQVFEAPEAALEAFQFFISLLKTRSSYRSKNDKTTCIFTIEIGETLLVSDRTYANKFRPVSKTLARYAETFPSQKDAMQKLPSVRSETQQAVAQTDNLNLLSQANGLFSFDLKDSKDSLSYLWKSERGYLRSATAQLASTLAKKEWSILEQYRIEELAPNRFNVTIQVQQYESVDSKEKDLDTVYAACPAIFEADTIQLGTLPVLVSEDCYEYADAACVETICPAAWDEGLQSFLIHAIEDTNYYSFIDYHQGCRWGFRVVTDQYRVARNTREFHLPAHQAQFKDWLYNYSRCHKESLINLPEVKYCRKQGRYHYYLEGGWISYQGYETKSLARQAYHDEVFDFYAYAQEVDFYELSLAQTPGEGRLLHLVREDSSIMAVSKATFLNEEEWNAAVLERILLARKFPYFRFEGKYGFQCFALEDAPVFTSRERTPCDPPLPGSISESNCEEDTSNSISVKVPGEVIWESIHEYQSYEDAACVFQAFMELLADKQNYHSIQLQDCNLFGIEITHPKEVLATHPQRYTTQTGLNAAIARTQDCINAEGFHLVEHILLRPKTGISNHITIQFTGRKAVDCSTEEEPIFEKSPYLLWQQVFTEGGIAQTHKEKIIEWLIGAFKNDDGNLQQRTEDELMNQLGAIRPSPFVAANLILFVASLHQIFIIAQENSSNDENLEQDFRKELTTFIFCFNKSESTKADTLIPICPDCENIEPLPVENASQESCKDSKQLLVQDEDSVTAQALVDYYVAGADPYSFWVTIVLPYWPKRFQNANFRNFFENTLRREAPAHIGLKICWLDPKQMRTFERGYKRWLEAFSGDENCNLQAAKNRLISILFDEEEGISNVYPPAQLQEGGCSPGGTSDPGAVLLDFTQLG